jgi:hypothetical protein
MKSSKLERNLDPSGVEGVHEIACRMNDVMIGLKACFVKKVTV